MSKLTLHQLIFDIICKPLPDRTPISFREFNGPPDVIVTKPAKKGKKS